MSLSDYKGHFHKVNVIIWLQWSFSLGEGNDLINNVISKGECHCLITNVIFVRWSLSSDYKCYLQRWSLLSDYKCNLKRWSLSEYKCYLKRWRLLLVSDCKCYLQTKGEGYYLITNAISKGEGYYLITNVIFISWRLLSEFKCVSIHTLTFYSLF